VAGIGDAWGTADEFLHPRDKHGRFRSKWKMAEGVVEKLTSFLSGFRPRTFQSDQQAAQYTQNLGGKKRFSLGELARLHADFAPAQEDLRDGDVDDASTKKFTQMMDSHAIELPDDVIVSRVVGPDAFGLTPETMNAEEGGLEDFTGKKIADRGYSPVNLGTPLGGGSGQITMSIAVPKGTKATIPGQGGNDRSMYLQRSQSYRVTKVKSDGRGGFYVLAVAENDNSEAPEPIGGHVGAGKPSNREGAVQDLQRSQAERMKAEPDQPSTAATPVGDGGQPQADNTPQAQAALPDGTQPRNEPVVAESIGGGPAPTAPARTDVTPAAPQATVPETPAAPAGPPLEDADVAKLRQRRDARQRYQAIADRVPQGNAGAELAELVQKKASNKTIAEHIRAYATGPSMDEVHKDQKDRVRAELEKVAEAFEQDKPTLGKQRMTKYLDQSNIELVGGPREGKLTHREQGAGKTVDFDEKYMESTGDIPENGKVQVIRPAVVYHPNGTGPNAVENEVVLEKAVVTAPTKSTRKAAVPAAKGAAAPAAKKAAPAKKATPRTSTAEDAAISILLERIGDNNPAAREAILRDLSPEDRKGVEEAQARHKTRMEGLAAKKAAAPAAKKATPIQGGTVPETVKGADGENIKVGDTVVIGTTNRGQYGRTEWKITKTYPNGTVDLQSTYETSTHKARTRNGVDPSTLRRAGATAAKKATPAAPGSDLDKATVADLRKIAADRGVDLKGLRLKKDIRDRIEGKSTPAPKSKAAEQRAAVEANRAGNDTSSRAKAAKTMVGEDLGSVDAVARAVSKKAAPAAASDKDARIQELLGKKPTVADLKKYAQDNDIPVTKSRPLKADLVDAILSHKSGKTPEAPAKKAAPTKKAVSGPPVRTLQQVTGANGRIAKIDRPRADEPIHLPNRGSDQGLVHLDSEVGSLWADLYADDREPNSFINEIARTGEDLGTGKIDLDEVLKRLRTLKEQASDKAVADRIDRAIERIDAPPVKVPDLPGIPAPVKKFLEDLAKIPTARKTGRIGASNPRESVLDKKIQAIRDFSEGKIRDRELERKLTERDLHESADGAFAMWRLGDRLMARTFEHYEKDSSGKIITVSEPNPDWPAVQQWLRDVSAKRQN
jgi:hypothetical protein